MAAAVPAAFFMDGKTQSNVKRGRGDCLLKLLPSIDVSGLLKEKAEYSLPDREFHAAYFCPVCQEFQHRQYRRQLWT